MIAWLSRNCHRHLGLLNRARAACQHALLAGFACFFAFVAPTICWGGVVEAAHGHAGAHFVFRAPVFPHTHGAGTLPHDHCLPPRAFGNLTEAAATESPTTPDGAARPATLLTALLIVLWLAELLPIRRLAASMRRLAQLPHPLSWCYAIPTPPPRPLPLG
jgi:hypothetical protein